eukprot:scaffold155134_cov14-Tisochrysis_lutea.AAC.2
MAHRTTVEGSRRMRAQTFTHTEAMLTCRPPEQPSQQQQALFMCTSTALRTSYHGDRYTIRKM